MSVQDIKYYMTRSYHIGFGNRINIILGDMYLAENYYKKPHIIAWQILSRGAKKIPPLIKNGIKTSEFSFEELFDISSINYFNHKKKKELYCNNSNINDLIKKSNNINYICYTPKGNEDKLRGSLYGPIYLPKDKNKLNNIISYNEVKFNETLHYTYDRTPKYFIDIYSKYINMLQPCAEIKSIVDNFSKKFNKYTITVHIRRGDNKHPKDDIHYYKIMNKLIEKDDKTNFFLLSDDPNMEKIVYDKYPSRCIYYNHDYDPSQLDKKTAFISILLGSKNNRLILTNNSTFSQLIWYYSGCNKETFII